MDFLKKALKSTVKIATFGGFGDKIFDAVKMGTRAPAAEGLSESERRALDEAKKLDDERRKRLSKGMLRRARVALGVSGGQRSLLFGGFAGVQPTLGGSTSGGGTE